MEVKGPRDVPDFRLWLMDQWRIGGNFDMAAKVQPPQVIDGEVVKNLDPPAQRALLPEAELWWVTEDMTHLVEHAARTLPETTLTEDLVPATSGLIVFGGSLAGSQADTGEPMTTDALTWVQAVYRRTGKMGLSICSYQYVPQGQQYGNSEHGYSRAPISFWAPTGTTNWLFGSDTQSATFSGFEGDELRNASHTEDRNWLAATWLLASQTLATNEVQSAERSAARRSSRRQVASDVRLVDVRPRLRTRSEPIEADGERRERDHRWMVAGPNGDGFWRQQAYGPGYSLHKPLWIAPFIQGPDDKPLKIRDTVRVLRGASGENSG